MHLLNHNKKYSDGNNTSVLNIFAICVYIFKIYHFSADGNPCRLCLSYLRRNAVQDYIALWVFHRQMCCLFNSLFSAKLWLVNPAMTGGFPSQRANNAESVPMSWQWHVLMDSKEIVHTESQMNVHNMINYSIQIDAVFRTYFRNLCVIFKPFHALSLSHEKFC